MKSVTGEDTDEDGSTMPKCDPGMKGCTLYGRYRFSTDAKNKPDTKAGPNTDQGDTDENDG